VFGLRFLSSTSSYNAHEVERKWREQVLKGSCGTNTNLKGDKRYILSMFPYPSGTLHMGHVRVYTISDALARYHRMQGRHVLHPMGWDAFGLPAENAARERGLDPEQWTRQNIKQMRQQLDSLGFSFDWDREVTTCDPDYYKWTQWLFLQFYKRGYAYRAPSEVNWDPVDKTVLANEQVDAQGRSWRSGAVVEKIQLTQWHLKITQLAQDLFDSLNTLDQWPDSVKEMQRAWISPSKGYCIDFNLADSEEILQIFTTRPETIFGVTFVALSEKHPLSKKVREGNVFAVHPITGERIPVLIAAYVLDDVGTGAVMGVPGHDERDRLFAQEKNLPVRQVIDDESKTLINSGDCSGQGVESGKKELLQKLGGRVSTSSRYRLRDWLVSRQRLWGTPIPTINCQSCGTVPVPDEDLPVFVAPRNSDEAFEQWKKVKCPSCSNPATRETDTLDTFIDSSWYFLRYCSFGETRDSVAFGKDDVKHWMPVDVYIGGIEHAILHLLYSRFFTMFLHENDLVGTPEPFKKLLTQGMVLGQTYKNSVTGEYLKPDQILKDSETGSVQQVGSSDPVMVVYEKMSKSKYNGVAPEDIISQFGADTSRLFILFQAPPEKELEFEQRTIEGQHRWLNRVWKLVDQCRELHKEEALPNSTTSATKEIGQLKNDVYFAIQSCTNSMETNMSLNVAIGSLMKLSNTLASFEDKKDKFFYEAVRTLLLLMHPFAPHFSAECWKILVEGCYPISGPHCGSADQQIFSQQWPSTQDLEASRISNVNLVIQINGKLRGVIPLDSLPSNEEELKKIALESDSFDRWVTKNDMQVLKTIVLMKSTKSSAQQTVTVNFVCKK
jgi:leucyl-tRNA synthetase